MTFPIPPHAGHVFIGYRGVSKKHFFIDQTKLIRYIPPPTHAMGASQLGAGIYVTDSVEMALDYAQDSAWNLYCGSFKNKNIDDHGARFTFEKTQCRKCGQVHAAFILTSKFNNTQDGIADFTYVNIDRSGSFIWDNIKSYYEKTSQSSLA
ncbi:hypothetical protein [Chromobacterium haemolyticum]|uniref:hypothetical protein n=1 Tax=Chromobacterium haemolyticum TaxID=394935 RepID=UPI00307DE49A